jgi:hypothetical protein
MGSKRQFTLTFLIRQTSFLCVMLAIYGWNTLAFTHRADDPRPPAIFYLSFSIAFGAAFGGLVGGFLAKSARFALIGALFGVIHFLLWLRVVI